MVGFSFKLFLLALMFCLQVGYLRSSAFTFTTRKLTKRHVTFKLTPSHWQAAGAPISSPFSAPISAPISAVSGGNLKTQLTGGVFQPSSWHSKFVGQRLLSNTGIVRAREIGPSSILCTFGRCLKYKQHSSFSHIVAANKRYSSLYSSPLAARTASALRCTDSDTNTVQNDSVQPQPQRSVVLFELSAQRFPIRNVAAYMHKWARGITSDGPALEPQILPDGVTIAFARYPGCFLRLFVGPLPLTVTDPMVADSVYIQAILANEHENPQVKALINFAVENMLDSFVLSINSLMVSGIQESTVAPDNSPNIAEMDIAEVIADPTKAEQLIASMWQESPTATEPLAVTPELVPSDTEEDNEDIFVPMSSWSSRSSRSSRENVLTVDTVAEPAVANEDISPNSIVGSNDNSQHSQSTQWHIVHAFDGWLGSQSQRASVVKALQASVMDKYSNRGAGISAVPSFEGIEVSFVIGSGSPLIVRLSDSDTMRTVVVSNRNDVIHTSDDTDSNNVENSSDKVMTNRLLAKAIDSIEQVVVQCMRSLMLTFDTSDNHSDSNDSNNMWSDLSVDEAVSAMPAPKLLQKVDSSTNLSNQQRKRDPRLLEKASDVGVRLESFEGRGLEEQAIKELEAMVENSKSKGFIEVMRDAFRNDTSNNGKSVEDVSRERFNATALFLEGSRLSLERKLNEILNRPNPYVEEDLSSPPVKLPFFNPTSGPDRLKIDETTIDLFEGPQMFDDVETRQQRQSKALSNTIEDTDAYSSKSGNVELEAIIAAPNPDTLPIDEQRLQLLLSDLQRSPADVHPSVLGSFRDLMLSENLLHLLRKANASASLDKGTSDALAKVSQYAAQVNLELVKMIQEESQRHLETIYQICDVAYKHQSNDATFTEEMDFLKPKFDIELLSFVKYAIDTEIQNIRIKGSDPAAMPSPWLNVLRVVYRGVLAEYETRFDRLLEPLLIVVRFEQRDIRRALLRRFINITAPMDLRHLKTLAENMVANVLQSGTEDEKLMTTMRDLSDDVDEFLSEAIVESAEAAFVAEARLQGTEVVWVHRNPEKQQMLLDQERQRGSSESFETLGKVGQSLLDRPKVKISENVAFELPPDSTEPIMGEVNLGSDRPHLDVGRD